MSLAKKLSMALSQDAEFGVKWKVQRAHARRLRQHPAGPMCCFARRRRQRQVDHPLHSGRRKRRLAGLARLVAGQAGARPSAMNGACRRHTTGLALPDRRMISVVP